MHCLKCEAAPVGFPYVKGGHRAAPPSEDGLKLRDRDAGICGSGRCNLADAVR